MRDTKRTIVQQEERLRDTVKSSVSKSIQDVLGESAMKVLAYHAPPELLITSPQEYRHRLSTVIGGGTSTLEHLIVKDLADALGIRREKEESDLVFFMDKVKSMILSGQLKVQVGEEQP